MKPQPFLPEKEDINWLHLIILTAPPSLAIVGLFTTPILLPTFIWSLIMYFFTGLSITGGYHRMWSHRAFTGSLPVRLFFAAFGAAALEGSAKWWCANHRIHHRFTDTENDPYNATRGFFYSHLGWMLFKQKKTKRADISDLKADIILELQHKYYLPVAIFFSVVFPVAVASLWGDAWGGFYFASMARIVGVHHATFFVNSLAHYLGHKPFSGFHTAHDSFITAILTLGEGYHNFHHEYPNDYRNAVKWYQYDPTKWLVNVLAYFNLAHNLKWFTDNEIKRAKIQQEMGNLKEERAHLLHGPKINANLPTISMAEVKAKCSAGEEKWVVIDGFVHDVAEFAEEHPGGRNTLLNFVGTDATHEFHNGLAGHPHTHTKAAIRFMAPLRVATIE